MLGVFAIAAVCLVSPVDGPVIDGYSPSGRYGGHWGVDYEANIGDPVYAPASGIVTFAGSVAGMQTITIQPVTGFKVSVSYLSGIGVSAGDDVRRGLRVGWAGVEDGVPGVHLSTRIGGRYVDPATQMGCRSTEITRALRLVTPPQPYPRRRANRNSRRDLRSHPHSPPARR
jgi:murein DD-endopeptidase MepM/ murein hydrolase activator NlpD